MTNTTTTETSKWERNLTDAWIKTYELPEGVDRERWVDSEGNGLQLVIGKRSRTFVVRAWVVSKGKRSRTDITIGQYGQGTGTGDERWNVKLARKRAATVAGNPEAAVAESAPMTNGNGPTLGDAFDAHESSMRKRKRSAVSISSFLAAKKYLGDLLGMPIAEITGTMLSAKYDEIRAGAKARAGAVNDSGVALANRVIVNVSAAWASLNKQMDGKLGHWNPTKSVTRTKLDPRRVVVADLPAWYGAIETIRNPIQHDGLLFALFTGLRHEDVCSIRIEHVDLDEGTLLLPDPKGGEDKAFTIPLSKTCIEIIERRIADNAERLRTAHSSKANPYTIGDGGWLFPTVVDGKAVAISDLREQRIDDDGNKTRFPAEDVHTLRRTFLSVAQEVGVSELDQHVLSNHAFGNQNVNSSYVRQHIDHLAACATKIEAGLWARIKPDPTTAKKSHGRRKLKAV